MNVAQVTRMIALRGKSATLKRSGQDDLTVMAFVQGYTPQELVGEVQEGDREARIGNQEIAAAGWPGPPKKGDQLVFASKTMTVQGVDTRYLGDEIAMHVMRVRG